jgi:predicted Zn-dependent protease
MYSCAVNPVTGKKEISLMSEAQEINMGKQADPSIVASFGLYDNPEIQAFINEKGQEMAKISHRPHLNYEFKVLDSPVVNAFAVPGGYVYFTRGILAHFSNEAEFAGVLGHEIGHITAKHSVRQQTSQTLLQLGFVLGVAVNKQIRDFAEPLSQQLGLLFLKFGRDHESESDRLGVEYSTKTGYDAHKMANFFYTLNRMREKSGQSIPTFQSTHPDPLNRYENVKKLSDKWQADLGVSNLAVNRNSYLKMIDGLMYGEDPQQGYVEDDYFYHPSLKFKFPVPREWRTANSPQQFQMADKEGKGMMVLMAGKGTLQESISAFNEKQKLQVVSSQNVRVNGYPALAQLADQKNEQTGATLRILTYLIEYGGLVYAIHGVSSLEDFPKYERTFTYTMTRFNELRDPAKINRVADQIKIEEVRRSGSLADVFRYYRMPSDRFEELALLNSMKLEDQIQTGTLIKTVVNPGGYSASKSKTKSSSNPKKPSTTTQPSNPKQPSTTTKPSNPKKPNTVPKKPSTTSSSGKKKIGKIKKKKN